MRSRLFSQMLLTLFLLSTITLAFSIHQVGSEPGTNGSWAWVRDTVTGAYGEAMVGAGEDVYITRKSSFYRYRPADNSWTVLAAPPNPDAGDAFKTGTAMAWDSGDYIYALYGAATSDSRRWFYRYSISGNSWQALANTPYDQGEGDAITWVSLDNSLYATIGGEQRPTYFLRYDPSTNTWSDAEVADPPAGMGDGASLVWTGDDFLYALRGEFYEESPAYDFWRYSITSDSWTAMADIPAYLHNGGVGGVGDGGSLVYIGLWLLNQTDFIYALSGNQAYPESPSPIPDYRFYRYTISTDSWERLTDLPFGVGYYVGCRLGYADGKIYAWQGTPSTWAGGGDDLAQYEFAQGAKTWTVDDDGPADFSKIQDAINAAGPGDTIYVFNGTYGENVVVNKTVSLIGENKDITIIDALDVQDSKAIMVTAHRANISGFTVRNAAYGIFLDHSSGNAITENIITLNDGGVQLQYSSSNYIADNVLIDNRYGMYISGSPNNLLRSNVFSGQISFNLWVGWVGGPPSYFIQDIDSSNTIDGKPICYWVNQHDKQVPSDAGLVAIVNSSKIVVENLNLTNYPGDKLLLAYSTDSRVRNSSFSEIHLQNSNSSLVSGNTITGEYGIGIRVDYSSSNSIVYNLMDNNTGTGIYLEYANDNVISDNKIAAEPSAYWTTGISLHDSHCNTISNNQVAKNVLAISFSSSNNNNLFNNTFLDNRGSAVQLVGDANTVSANKIIGSTRGISWGGHKNTFSWNTISNNTYGMEIWGAWWDSTDNYIIANLIANNTYGIKDSMDNYIYYNNFIDNAIQMLYSERNVWDDGNGKGNYWSDYMGDDLNGDGVGNTLVPHLGVDWYPLIDPWIDVSSPATNDNYDGRWHNTDFTVTLTAVDDISGIAATYYKINDGSTKTVNVDGHPRITTEGINNLLEYWSADNAGNEETPHKILTGIKLDKTTPTANAGADQTVNEDAWIPFDGSASTDENGIAGYTWTFTDETAKILTGEKLTYIFSTPGIYTVILNVTDAAGNWATDTIVITVLDITNPVVNAGQNQTVNVGETVNFDASASSDNVDIVSYEWDFGDGTTRTGVTTSHLYSTPETYTVTLTVKDAAGNSATHSVIVTVLSAKGLPPLNGAIPIWIVGATLAAITIATTTILFLKRKKRTVS